MRKKIAVLLIFSSLFYYGVTIAQKKSNTVIINGYIETNLSNQIKINNLEIHITENGTFKFELNIVNPDFCSFQYEKNKFELFISPGDSLYITFNGSDFFTSLVIKRNNALLNEFLLNQAKLRLVTDKYLNDNSNILFNSDQSGFCFKIDSIKQFYLNNINALKNKYTDLNAWFQTKCEADIIYGFDRIKLIYPQKYFRNNGKRANIDSTYFEKIAVNAFNNPELLRLDTYQNFLNKYLDIQSSGENKYIDFYQSHANIKGDSRYQAI
jgi:hypothetical protein